MDTHRRCTKCGERKPLDTEHFSRTPTYVHSSGFKSQCRLCDREYQHSRRARIRASQEDHFKKHPPAVMEDEPTQPQAEPRTSSPHQTEIPRIEAASVFSERTLAIGDTHAPFAHPDALTFLAAIKSEFSPDFVVHQGDEVDNHGMSFHEKNPALPGASAELDESRAWIRQLEAVFPEVVLLESNHGSLLYRKALHHGIPEEMLRNYNEVLRVGPGWRWQLGLTIQSPSGLVYFEHGQKATARTISKRMGVSVVQGHRHNEAYSEWWNNSLTNVFAMQTGCLIDNRSRTFLYNRKNETHPVIGTGLILDGKPYVVRLGENKSGRWDRRLGLSAPTAA